VTQRTLLLTGFVPFLDVKVNASGELAKRVDGLEVEGVLIRTAVLPVSFRELPGAYAAALEGLEPVALCSMGVQREAYYRLESRARAKLESEAPDNLGEFAGDQPPLGPADLACQVDLEALTRAMQAANAGDVRVSDDAGGYLCERCYWEALSTGKRLGVPGLFLHVPPVEAFTIEEQVPVVTAMLAELIRQADLN
jgi:pyroglutamyl-peptidase